MKFLHILVACGLLLPGLVAAQAFRCTDSAGQVLYTDQPCTDGALVVPERTAEQQQAENDRALAARQRQLQREETVLQLAQDRQERDRARLEQQQSALPSQSVTCLEARQEAAERAGSVPADSERLRTARANAALACGQPVPEEVVVVHRALPTWGVPGRYAGPRRVWRPRVQYQPPYRHEPRTPRTQPVRPHLPQPPLRY